ncbi:MAG: hypothetical protein IT446_12870 [Phycisphaerales bacterium]|nr:hypothetical protein [Phycisphaerales bacterium]
MTRVDDIQSGRSSGRQRVLGAMHHEPTGTIAVWSPGFEEGFVGRWRRYMGFGDDEKAHPLTHYRNDTEEVMGDERFFFRQAGLLHHEGEYEIHNDGWGCTVRTSSKTYFSQVIDRMLKEPADLDRLDFDPPTLESRYHDLGRQMEQVNRLGQCAFAKIGGIFIRSQFFRGEENLLIDMASDESFCDALFDRVAAYLQEMALQNLRRTNTWETGMIVNDDMAGLIGPVFSPRMFERYLLPRYHRIIQTCRQAGCRHFIFHSDGNVQPLLELLIECGFEGINPIEPRCNPSLMELKRKYGRKLVLLGGVCNTQILQRNNRREIQDHLRPLIELAREGGVVLGTASIPAETPPEAYDFMMRCIEDA